MDEIERAEQARAAAAFDHHARSRAPLRRFEDSLSSEVFLLMAALVTVYIVLGVLYESYIHPVTILSTLPSAGHRRAARADDGRQATST